MKLIVSSFPAPSPRRVLLFLAEKGISDLPTEAIDLGKGAQHDPDFVRLNPMRTVPSLVLDDGRVLSESRAICSWIEARHPQPNLMGSDSDEHAFIEMWDRRMDLVFYQTIANAIRHTHPGFANVEQPQLAEYGAIQRQRAAQLAAWLDAELATRDWVAGDRFTIADLTAFCALEFAKLLKFKPAEHGLSALQAWRDRVAARPAIAATLR